MESATIRHGDVGRAGETEPASARAGIWAPADPVQDICEVVPAA